MGGGVMRTAVSRLVGAGAAAGGIGGLLRGSQSVPKPEYQAPFTAARRPSSAIEAVASVDGGSVVVEKALSGVDDWEFAGVEGEVVFGGSSGDSSSLPRVVFGSAPSFDEAKEATLKLKAAVDQTLSSENGSLVGYKEATLPLLMGSESVTSHVSSEVVSANAVPRHAVQAFRFLSENPSAQNVVASIASDPNVWNAVLQNSAFVDYLESQRAGATSPDADGHLNQHIGIEELQNLNCYAESETSFTGSSESNESGNSIGEIFQNIKLTLMDMVNHVSSFFQDVFGPSNEKPSDDAVSGTASFIESTTLKASIMGLAIMVISMVLLKRA